VELLRGFAHHDRLHLEHLTKGRRDEEMPSQSITLVRGSLQQRLSA
jgi:hypothetical protein